VKENSRLTSATTTTTFCNDDISRAFSQQQQQQQQCYNHYRLTSIWSLFQSELSIPCTVDSSRRKSPSIFSSVEELARGARTNEAAYHVTDHVTSTPISDARRSPLACDLSADSGYGDSAVRDVTSGLGRTPELESLATDDVIKTPRAVLINPGATLAPLFLNGDISGSGISPVTSDKSKTGLTEKLRPEDEVSPSLLVAMETASSPPLPQRTCNSQPVNVTSPLQTSGKSPQPAARHNDVTYSTREYGAPLDGGDHVEKSESQLELIHGGFGVRNPLLKSRADDTRHEAFANSQPPDSKDFGKPLLFFLDFVSCVLFPLKGVHYCSTVGF